MVSPFVPKNLCTHFNYLCSADTDGASRARSSAYNVSWITREAIQIAFCGRKGQPAGSLAAKNEVTWYKKYLEEEG